MRRHDSDVCIVGAGICAAQLAQKLAERRPGLAITVVEAGARLLDERRLVEQRDRGLAYGENIRPGALIEDQSAKGVISRTMAVGGQALHWGAIANRFSEEELRLKSLYGLAVDWPLEWTELERAYCEAERRMGVEGEPSPLKEDWRSEPLAMPPMPLTWNLRELKAWAAESGLPFWGVPQAKNTVPFDGRGECLRCGTCDICPTGASYTPDYTFDALANAKKIALHPHTLIRQLVVDDRTARIVAARGNRQDRSGEEVEYRARLFVLATGYCWSPHLLLLSACPRFPNGLANSSGLVGRYMTGHQFVSGFIELDAELYPGMNDFHSLVSRVYLRCPADRPYVRHDLRIWESAHGRAPRLRDASGTVLMGGAMLADWRARTKRGCARVRGYYDVHPDATSALTLDAGTRNRWGDPMPAIEHRIDAASAAREVATKEHIRGVFSQMAKARNGKVLATSEGRYQDHPGGGCRMGTDPRTSVCDSFGRTHDHENLYVVGYPTMPTGGCINGTLTAVALTLRSADRIAADLGPPA